MNTTVGQVHTLPGATTKPARKPRAQGKIANLLPEQREQIHQWFRDNLHYSQISARVLEAFGIKIASSTLSDYYHGHWEEIFGGFRELVMPKNGQRLVLRLEIPVFISQSTAGGEPE